MGEMTKNQKKEALRAWRQKEKKSYCLEKEEVDPEPDGPDRPDVHGSGGCGR